MDTINYPSNLFLIYSKIYLCFQTLNNSLLRELHNFSNQLLGSVKSMNWLNLNNDKNQNIFNFF
jgi:hypothetical protein